MYTNCKNKIDINFFVVGYDCVKSLLFDVENFFVKLNDN